MNHEEVYDSLEVLLEKAKTLAELVRKSKYLVIQTGAGVSTSSGIPDFRGPQGVWTLKEQNKKPEMEIQYLDQALPTFSHMAIHSLMQNGPLQFVVTSNLDGLHRKSGIPSSKQAEVHGCIFKEKCEKCRTTYVREYDVVGSAKQRYTGRLCDDENCNGKLKDTIINFGEYLPQEEMKAFQQNVQNADLYLVIGSSLKVNTGVEFFQPMKRRGVPIVIVNLQKTPYDHLTSLRVFGKCDEFLRLLMQELNIDVPKYSGRGPLTDEELREIRKTMKIDPEFEKLSKYGQFMDAPPPKSLLFEIKKFSKNNLKKTENAEE